MSDIAINLSQAVVEEMQRLEFCPNNVGKFQTGGHYQTAQGQEPMVQKTYLTLALASVLNSGQDVVPSEIRLGLNMAHTVADWLTDIKLIVLPFIKANEEKLFGAG